MLEGFVAVFVSAKFIAAFDWGHVWSEQVVASCELCSSDGFTCDHIRYRLDKPAADKTLRERVDACDVHVV